MRYIQPGMIRFPTATVAVLAAAFPGLGGCGGPVPEPAVQGNGTESRFSNPVIPGFAPDPSIVRVDDNFYLVNAAFEYFPGLPVYRSTDLVNWSLIGHALREPSQVDLASVDSGGGVRAPTIRHHEGRFYIVVSGVLDSGPVTFIVSAADPGGPWSPPTVLEHVSGVGSSLFFDDNGRAWFSGSRAPPDPEFPGQTVIWLQELDPEKLRLTGEKHNLRRGCCQGAPAANPHIYKKDGRYYLLLSEGGTSFEHAVSIAVSEQITGPYRENPRNPILTHRHLGHDYPITGMGHADLVELADGRWYAVARGWRLVEGRHGVLGGETFLAPLTWETGPHARDEQPAAFPVISPHTDRIELHYALPFEGTTQEPQRAFFDNFDARSLRREWNLRRAHPKPFHNLSTVPGILRLDLQPGFISPNTRYSFIGVRQRHFRFEAATAMRFRPEFPGEEAGLALIRNDRTAYLMTLTVGGEKNRLELYGVIDGQRTPLADREYPEDSIHLGVHGDYLGYSFSFSADGESWTPLADDIDGTPLSPATSGSFDNAGIYIGLYASSNGAGTDNYADFGSFSYRPADADRDRWFRRQAERMQ